MVKNFENWPVEYKEKVILGNPTSNIGIATLWTTRDIVCEKLNKEDYCIVANFYDVFNGLEPLVRNCLSNTDIRYILIVGNDRAKSKEVLMKFFEDGVDENHIVNGTNTPLPKEIPREELQKLKKNVEIFDLTSELKSFDDPQEYKEVIEKCIKNLKKRPSYDENRIFPKKKIVVETFPSTGAVYKFESAHVAECWLKILGCINKYGSLTQTTLAESSKVKECINVISVITGEDPDAPFLPDFMKFDESAVFKYFENFTTGKIQKDTSYTYGTRFFNSPNQFDLILDMIVENIYTKRAYTTTWRLSDQVSGNPPCVISFQPNIQGDRMFATAYIRSNDMFRAWPLNAFGLRKIQKNLLSKLNAALKIPSEKNTCAVDSEEDMIKLGPLTIISHSAHVYAENFEDMSKIVGKYCKFTPKFEDIAGYYVISIHQEKKEIDVSHFSCEGKLLRKINGKSSNEIFCKLSEIYFTDDKFHILYLGKELGKAEIAIKNGIEYIQDVDLEFS